MALSRRQIWDVGLFGALLLLSALVVRGWLSESRQPDERPGGKSSGPPRLRPASLQPPQKSSGPAVDLVKLLDLEKDSVEGNWKRDGAILITPEIQRARIQLPIVPPEEYDIRALVTRKSPKDAFVVGLVFDGKPCMVVIDGNGAGASWMEVKDGKKGVSENGITYFDGNSLKRDRQVEILYVVRKDRLTVTVDTYTILDWRGDKERLFIGKGWEVPRTDALFIGSYETVFHVEEMTLTPVSGSCTLLR